MNHLDSVSVASYPSNAAKRRARFQRLKARKNSQGATYRTMRRIAPPAPNLEKQRRIAEEKAAKLRASQAIQISERAIESNTPPVETQPQTEKRRIKTASKKPQKSKPKAKVKETAKPQKKTKKTPVKAAKKTATKKTAPKAKAKSKAKK